MEAGVKHSRNINVRACVQLNYSDMKKTILLRNRIHQNECWHKVRNCWNTNLNYTHARRVKVCTCGVTLDGGRLVHNQSINRTCNPVCNCETLHDRYEK